MDKRTKNRRVRSRRNRRKQLIRRVTIFLIAVTIIVGGVIIGIDRLQSEGIIGEQKSVEINLDRRRRAVGISCRNPEKAGYRYTLGDKSDEMW